MRREAQWSLRWMMRGPGLALTFLFTMLAAIEIAATSASARFDGMQFGLMLNLAIAMELCALTFAIVTWVYLVWRRTLAFFRPERLVDILLTPLRPNDLWPAMLGAPTATAMILAVIWEVLVVGLPFAFGDRYYLLHLYLRPVGSMSPESLWWIQAMTWFRVPIVVVEAGALSLVSAAAGAYFVLPSGGAVRLVLVLAFVQLLVAPEILFSLWVDDRAVLSGTVGQPRQLFCDHIAGPFMTIVLSWLVFRLLLRLLRGRSFWDRLRVEAESAG
jgi:hypothetical protein